MVDKLCVVIAAVVLSIGLMMLATWMGDFVNAHPQAKCRLLSFMVLIGSRRSPTDSTHTWASRSSTA